MELRGSFLPQFKVRETQLALFPSAKRNSVIVAGMFTRETFPAQYDRWKNLEVHCNDDQSIRHSGFSKKEGSNLPELSFDRLQLTEQECSGFQRWTFGHFVARQAILDEEYWTAAWLRAEAHWESLHYIRHVDSHKMRYAEEEFLALKRRCSRRVGNSLSCFCFVAVKKEDKNVRRTVLKSIVGTLDLSIRQFVQGETYPGEIKRLSPVLASQEPFDAHKYAYVANVCVAKYARRQGIASNMLYLATDAATAAGVRQMFVHVNADKKPAQDLYRKVGFKAVERAPPPTSEDQKILMSMDL